MDTKKSQNTRKIRMKNNKNMTKYLKWQYVTNEGKHEDALQLYDKSLSLLNIIDEIFRWKSESLNPNYLHIIQYFICKELKKELNVVIWPYTQIRKMIMPITTKDGHYRRIVFIQLIYTTQNNLQKLLNAMIKQFN